jgi:outer membrane protein assembly factor BamB
MLLGDGYCLSLENEHDLVRRELVTGKEEWRFRAEEPFVTGVAGADGLVIAGTADDHISAWRMGDGTLQWTYHLGFANQVVAEPLVADGRVYAGAERVLVALHAEDGTHLWHAFPGQDEHPYWPIWRAEICPLFVQQGVTLVLRTTFSGDPYSGGGPNMAYTLIAYAQDGTRVWDVGHSSLEIVGQEAETLYLHRGARPSQIVALQARSGEQVWSYELASVGYRVARAEAGTLYVYDYTGATVQAIDLRSTLPRWVTHL